MQHNRKVFGGKAEEVLLSLYEARKTVLNKRMESAFHASKFYFMHLIQVKCGKRKGKMKAMDKPKDYKLS